MKNIKYLFISAIVFLLTSCSTQNFYMSQGDNNKNEPKLTEPSDNEDKSGEKEKDDKIPDEKDDSVAKTKVEEDNKDSEKVIKDEDKSDSNEDKDMTDQAEMSGEYLVTDIEPYAQKGYYTYKQGKKMGGDTYNNFFSLAKYDGGEYCSFNLKGNYKKLKGIIGNIDGDDQSNFKVSILGDKKELESYEIKEGDLPIEIEVDITGVKELRFEITEGSTSYHTYYLGFGDMEVLK